MLLPDNIKPEDSIYYNGAKVLEVVQQKMCISVTDLYVELREKSDLSVSILLLSLDWLYLIDCITINNGEVSLCL